MNSGGADAAEAAAPCARTGARAAIAAAAAAAADAAPSRTAAPPTRTRCNGYTAVVAALDEAIAAGSACASLAAAAGRQAWARA